jgi:hypothetical protein
VTNYVVPPLVSPDTEDLAIFYYTPIIAPTLIDTRLPKPDDDADTINGFVTVEAGDKSRVGLAQWDCSFILHSYSPVEAQAADTSNTLMTHGTAVQGLTVMGWYIVGLVAAVGSRKLSNPDIPQLARYRSALTWRVAGRPI